MSKHKHEWRNSYTELGLVGSLYRHIWPYVCKCGALRKYDYYGGEILEPQKARKG